MGQGYFNRVIESTAESGLIRFSSTLSLTHISLYCFFKCLWFFCLSLWGDRSISKVVQRLEKIAGKTSQDHSRDTVSCQDSSRKMRSIHSSDQVTSPRPYEKIFCKPMNNSAGDASGCPALQSALSSGPALPPPPQINPMMMQPQMVQPGQVNNNHNHNNINDLRRLAPRQAVPSMVLAYPNRMQVRPVHVQHVVNARIAPVGYPQQPFPLPPMGAIITPQQLQQYQQQQHHQIQIQHIPPQQQIRNHPAHPQHPLPQQPLRNGHISQNGNAEVITLNDSSASPENSRDGASVGDASDMPVLDRQDAQSTTSGDSSESSDHQTDTSRGIFVRESEEYNEMAKGAVVPHILADNVCIMESTEPFATTAPSVNVEDEEEEVASHTEPDDDEPFEKKRKATRTWTRGRGRGRPRGGRGGRRSALSREGETSRQEREPDTRTPSPEEKTTEEKKKRKRKRGEAERLLAMDFGPLAGERIMPENRRNRGSGLMNLMDMDDSPASPPRRTRRRRHSAESDLPDELPTEEDTDEDDDETEASEYESKTPKRMNHRRPQWCADACRSTSLEKTIRRGRRRRGVPSESDESDSPEADRAAPEEKPDMANQNQVEFEVVEEGSLAVPTEGQKQSRKTTGKEGEGADKKDPPARRRLRLSSSSYTSENLPGCSGLKMKRKQPSPKPERSKTPKSVRQTAATTPVAPKKEDPEPVPMKEKDESPMVVPKKEETTPAPISRTPSNRLDMLNLPPGNPETWDLETTVDYAAKEFGSEVSQLCQKYELDGYVLFHGSDQLERMRKAHFKLDNGKGVPFGPWKKMTSAMQTLKDMTKDVYPSTESSLMNHGLTNDSTTEDLYKWIEKISSATAANALRPAEFTLFGILGVNADELVKYTSINYGPALKISHICSKAVQIVKWPCQVALDIATHFQPQFQTAEEFEYWLSIFMPPNYAKRLVQEGVDLTLLYFITPEEYMEVLELPLGPAKSIDVAMKIIMDKVNGVPIQDLCNVRGNNLASLLPPNTENFEELLKEVAGSSTKLRDAQRMGLDATLAFLVTLKELTKELHLPFGAAKRLMLKIDAIKSMEDYREADLLCLPANFAQTYQNMAVEDVAKWASTFCLKEDVSILSNAAINGQTLPFLTEDALKGMKLSFASMRKIAFKTKSLPPQELNLPAHFESFEGKKMEEWIEQVADEETRSLVENAALRGSYFNHVITVEDLVTLGVKFGPALRIIALAQKQPPPSSKVEVPEVPLAEWTVDDVYKWVSSLTTPEVAEQMRNNQIEGETLQNLTFEELMLEVEIPFGPAKIISAMLKLFANERQQ